jgi:hypothetical protein
MHMDRAIFDLKASVEATSLYILLCALLDQGEVPTLNRATAQWNGSRASLIAAADELILRCVLRGDQSSNGDQPLELNPREKWS